MKHRSSNLLYSAIGLVLSTLSAHAACGNQPTNFDCIDVTANRTPIEPKLYGVNYDWEVISQADYYNTQVNSYSEALSKIAGRQPSGALGGPIMQRYPAGWNAEHYNWQDNSEKTWNFNPGATAPKGATPEDIYSGSTSYPTTFPAWLLRAHDASGAANDTDFWSGVSTDETIDSYALAKYNGDVTKKPGTLWEIGNEWWNDSKALQQTTDTELAYYTKFLLHFVATAHSQAPHDGIYITGRWETADDFNYMHNQFRINNQLTDWSYITGASIHVSCQTNNATTNPCTALPTAIANIKAAMGTPNVYVSEWHPAATDGAYGRYGLQHATALGALFKALFEAGVNRMAYWATGEDPQSAKLGAVPEGTGLLSGAQYTSNVNAWTPQAAGKTFDWLQTYFQGSAYANTVHPATNTSQRMFALVGDGAVGGQINVIIFTADTSVHNVQLHIPNGLNGISNTPSVVASKVMYGDANGYASTDNKLQTPFVGGSVGQVTATRPQAGETVFNFTLNPGGAGRGSAWEIAYLQIK